MIEFLGHFLEGMLFKLGFRPNFVALIMLIMRNDQNSSPAKGAQLLDEFSNRTVLAVR